MRNTGPRLLLLLVNPTDALSCTHLVHTLDLWPPLIIIQSIYVLPLFGSDICFHLFFYKVWFSFWVFFLPPLLFFDFFTTYYDSATDISTLTTFLTPLSPPLPLLPPLLLPLASFYSASLLLFIAHFLDLISYWAIAYMYIKGHDLGLSSLCLLVNPV